MNLLEIVNRIKSESGRSGGDLASFAAGNRDDLRLVAAARSAWLWLENDREWSWQRKSILDGAVVDAQAAYTAVELKPAATDFRSWWPESREYRLTIYPSGNQAATVELRFMPYERFRQSLLVGAQTPGAPQHWSISPEGKMLLGPAPLGAWVLQADYRASPTTLADEAAVPVLPTHYHEIIVWRALMEAASLDAASEVYDRAVKNFSAMHGDLKRDHGPAWSIGMTPLA